MLQLRAFGDSPTASELAEQLRGVPGIRHVAVLAGSGGGTAALTADVRADVADRALSLARGAGIPAEDVSLLRLEVIGPAGAADNARGRRERPDRSAQAATGSSVERELPASA